jgi:hypothetical protein
MKNTKQFTPTLDNIQGLFLLPSLTRDDFIKYSAKFDKLPRDEKVKVGVDENEDPIYKKVSWVEKDAIENNSKNILPLGLENIAQEKTISSVIGGVNDGQCRIKNANIKPKVGQVLKGSKAIVAMRQTLNLERDALIPLPHSHFSISLKSMSPAQKIKLNEMIVEALTDYCSESLGLIFSHDSVVYYKAIFDFLEPLIKDHTLIIPQDKHIYDYIDARDITSILVYLSTALHPKGVESIITCNNKMEIKDDEKELKCKHTLKGLLNPKEMLYVTEEKIPEDGMSLLRKTKPNSITVDEMIKSKENATYHIAKTFDYSGVSIDITFCSINDYLSSGDAFINRLLDLVDDTVMLMDDVDERKNKINQFVRLLVVNKYSHFISRIKIGDIGEVNDQETIFELLEDIVEEDSITTDIINDIVSTIQTQKISYVATPEYKCDNCKKTTNEDDKVVGEKLIELNPLEVFTSLRIM